MSLLWLSMGLPLGGTGAELQIQPTSDTRHIEVSAQLPPALRANFPAGQVPFADAKKVLWLSLVTASGEVGPPILGRYSRNDNRLLFRPRFGLTAKQNYRAFFRKSDKEILKLNYRPVEPKNAKPPTIVKVFPTASELPANHLRFVILFSQPMRGGKEIFDQIKIIDENGKEVVGPWLCNELWDDTGTMLVLYIHPGRIKWGVLLRMTMGPVLEPNREYSLVIEPEMLAANGKRLGKEYRKKFRAVAENRKRISLAKWTVQSPKAGTTQPQPLTLKFANIIDHNSLLRFLHVENADGKKIEGEITIGKEERSWHFVPNQVWHAERHTIVVDPRLEDHAGNSPVRPFDLDLDAPKQRPQKLRISFTPN